MNTLGKVLGSSLVTAAVFGVALGAQAQMPAQLDHYLCYKGTISKGELKLPSAPRLAVDLTDPFETRTYDVGDPIWHCNPVTKTYNGVTEPITFPDIHLQGYPLKLTRIPAPNKQLPDAKPIVSSIDQFGLVHLKLAKPESVALRASTTELATPPYVACGPSNPCAAPGTVCVPATGGFCLTTDQFQPPPANDGSVDNFKCYKVVRKGQPFTKRVNQTRLDDQFTTPAYPQWGFDLVKPTRICLPVDKAGENPGAPAHPRHLVCYQVKNTKPPFPPADKFRGRKVADANANFPNQRMDVKAVAELCVPATTAICGDGVVAVPYEECDAPKICSAASGGKTGQPCTKAADCSPGTCIANTTQCPGGVACAANCTCPLPKADTCHPYQLTGQFLDVCVSVRSFPGCAEPNPVPAYPVDLPGTDFTLCTSAADANGMRALTAEPETWRSDPFVVGPPVAPLPLTIRMCAAGPLSGVVFTKATTGTKPPAKFCLTGDPDTLRAPCTADAECEGPVPVTGNGLCWTRDVDYTSGTDLDGTTVSMGNGVPDAAGAALIAQDLRVDVYLGDVTCVGDGDNPLCVGCDDVEPVALGRIGIDLGITWGDPPYVALPVFARFTTGSARNTITGGSGGGELDGREMGGSGVPGLTSQFVVVGATAQVYGSVDIQMLAKQVFGPYDP